jgi:hypothetical protein
MPRHAPIAARHCRVATAALALWLCAEAAQAWTLTLGAATRRVYLQVGVGSFQANVATVNLVSVTVPGNQIGTGVAQAMTSNSTQARSPYDDFLLCATPAQVYVGATYQRSNAANGPANAVMQVTSPANLVSAAGDTIPFSEIRWTVSTLDANDASPGVIPAGSFTGGTQTLTNVPANRLIENCHTFSFANLQPRAAGTYTGTVTYTVAAP